MASRTYKVKNGPRVMLFDFGGIDVEGDDGKWRSVATTPEACADLARLALLAASGKVEGDDDAK